MLIPLIWFHWLQTQPDRPKSFYPSASHSTLSSTSGLHSVLLWIVFSRYPMDMIVLDIQDFSESQEYPLIWQVSKRISVHPRTLFLNQESGFKSSLADYWNLLLECLLESAESLLPVVWLDLFLIKKAAYLGKERSFWYDVYYFINLCDLTSTSRGRITD